jgi:hypothetical protein
MIYKYNGTAWEETIPVEGISIYVEGGATYPTLTVFYKDSIDGWKPLGISIDHANLQNIGTNTHAQIDSHISNTTTAHFGQDLKITGTPTFNSLILMSTSDATNSNSGALQIDGGIGVVKSVFVGKNLDVVSDALFESTTN